MECAICCDPLDASPSVNQVLGCSHTFHAACIESWAERSNECPLCRHPIHTDEEVVSRTLQDVRALVARAQDCLAKLTRIDMIPYRAAVLRDLVVIQDLNEQYKDVLSRMRPRRTSRGNPARATTVQVVSSEDLGRVFSDLLSSMIQENAFLDLHTST